MRQLATGAQRYVGNVGSYAFDDSGKLLAYTVRGQQRLGNGVYVMTLASGEQKMLDAAAADYDQLTWSSEGTNLAVLRGDKPKGKAQKENVAARVAERRHAAAAAHDVRSGQSLVVPGGHGRERVHRAALELGRRARARRPQGAGHREAGVRPSRKPTSTCGTGKTMTRSRCRSFRSTRSAARRRRPSSISRPARFARSPTRTCRRSRRPTISRGRSAASTRRIAARSRGAAAKADVYRVNLKTGERTLIEPGLSRTMGYLAGRQVVPVPEGRPRLLVRDGDGEEDADRRQHELRQRGGRSRLREAGVRRRRIHRGRQVGAALRPLRRVVAAARGRHADESDEGRRREAGSAIPRRRSWRPGVAAAAAAVAAAEAAVAAARASRSISRSR